MPEAFITLATNDEYSLGAINLAMSLKRAGTTRDIVIMITDTVSESMRLVLNQVFNLVELVDVLNSNDAVNLGLLERPDLGITFTKLHCWRLIQYSKAVFMDADTFVLQNVDDLFDREEFSAAPDPGWPDCFNSGVFVFQPSMDRYRELLQFALEHGSFDGGDQGLLNMFFKHWPTSDIKKHLPFVYNCSNQAFYSYAPALMHYHRDIKVVHFIGSMKPWNQTYDPSTGQIQVQEGSSPGNAYLNDWWSVFVSDTKPLLPENMVRTLPGSSTTSTASGNDKEGLCGKMASLDVSSFCPTNQGVFTPKDHQQAWEHGIIDYRGLDRFENIKQHLDSKLAGKKK